MECGQYLPSQPFVVLTVDQFLSKGLNFVPILKKKTNEFSVKQDVEKFLRCVQLKAFFYNKEDDSDNHAVKSIILKNFKLLQNDSETGTIYSQPPLISFKLDKNIGNFLVSSSFQTSDQSGTFKCARSRCKTCPFIHNVEKISGPKRSIKIIDHFTCTSANVIYCITCTYCNKLYIGETGRRLGDRFREHLRDVERNDKDASKPVARHFNLPNHSKQHMAVCSLSLHLGSSESRKTLEQKFIFQIGTLNPHGINERFSFN